VQVFRSLSHRPFRHYFIGQTVSLIGFWLQSIALSWLVYRLTGSAVMLGTVVFATSIPMLVLMPAAGILTDRVDRRRLVIMTQSVQMVQALVLALLTFTGLVSVSVIIVLALVQGVAAAFDAPVRQALLTVMVPTRAELPNAIALNSLIMNLARFVGPALAGVLLDVLGEGWCFLLNGVSFLAVLISMFRLPAQPAQPSGRAWRRDLMEGFSWVWTLWPARVLMFNLVLMSLTAPAYQTLMPIFAQDIHAGDASLQGLLVSCAGAGALAGTLMLAARPSVRGLGAVINLASLAAALGLICFALTTNTGVAGASLVAVGFGIIVTAAGTNTVLQSLSDDRLRGRVIAVYIMAFLGMMPVGSLALGWLAARIGPQFALAAFGALGLVSALLLLTRQRELTQRLTALLQEHEPPRHR
jgi:MFS family permease